MDTYTVQYKLRLDDWNVMADVTSVTVPGNETSVFLRGLLPASQYDVRIVTNNARGSSDFSSEATFSTLGEYSVH